MQLPYNAKELDGLIRACISFTADIEPSFAASNISGREDVIVDQNTVRKMMDWVVDMEDGVLDCKGFGLDNITYFQLGHNARQFMDAGGFQTHFQRKKKTELIQQLKGWAPIVISLFALLVAIAALQDPDSTSDKIDKFKNNLTELQTQQANNTEAIAAIQKALAQIAPASKQGSVPSNQSMQSDQPSAGR